MPRKVVTIKHVYKVTVLLETEVEMPPEKIQKYLDKRLSHVFVNPDGEGDDWELLAAPAVCELCFDEHGGEHCTELEGHRGLHTGNKGGRWGKDL